MGDHNLKQLVIISYPFIVSTPFNFEKLKKEWNIAKSPYGNIKSLFQKFKNANPHIPIVSNVPIRFRTRIEKIMVNLDLSESGHGAVSIFAFPGANPKQFPFEMKTITSSKELKQIRSVYKKILNKALRMVEKTLKTKVYKDDIFINLFWFGDVQEMDLSEPTKMLREYVGRINIRKTKAGEIHIFSKKAYGIFADISLANTRRGFVITVFHAILLAYCCHVIICNSEQIPIPSSNTEWTKLLVSLNPFVISGRNRANYSFLNGLARTVFIKLAFELAIFKKFNGFFVKVVSTPDRIDYPGLLTLIYFLYRIPILKYRPPPPLMIKPLKDRKVELENQIIDHLEQRMRYYFKVATEYLTVDEKNIKDHFQDECISKHLMHYKGGDIISNICKALNLNRSKFHNDVRDSLNQLMSADIVEGKHLKVRGIHRGNLVYFIKIDETKFRQTILDIIESVMPPTIVTLEPN